MERCENAPGEPENRASVAAPPAAGEAVQTQFDLGTATTDIAESWTKMGQAEKALGLALRSVAIHETLMAADPSNTGYMRDGRLAYERLGNAHAALAAREALSAAKSLGHWTDARTAYQRASQLFTKLAAKGATRPDDGETSERLKMEIARCEAAIVPR